MSTPNRVPAMTGGQMKSDVPVRFNPMVDDVVRRSGGLVKCVGWAPAPTLPQILHVSGPNAWAVMRLDDDPHVRNGQLAIPRRVRRHLERIDRAGVMFDDFCIAHEVPHEHAKKYVNADLKDQKTVETLIGPPTKDRGAERIAAGVAATTNALFDAAAAAATVSVGMLGALALDPAIFGLVKPNPRHEEAIWFILAAWT